MATRKTSRSASARVVKKSSASSNLSFKNLIFPIFIAVVIILLGLFRNQFIVATVNGRPITRVNLLSELEKRNGKTVLDALVTQQLILQETEKRKITVSDKEVAGEVGKIEKSVSGQGQNLDLLLAQQNMSSLI